MELDVRDIFRSTAINNDISIVPMKSKSRMGAIRANSTAATPSESFLNILNLLRTRVVDVCNFESKFMVSIPLS
jgi:hypothetical protein